MSFVDFAELKTRVSIGQAMQLLGLNLTLHGSQYRGACPVCKTGGDRALILTPAKGLFYCFAKKIGGDVIALTAHIRGVSVKEAADQLDRAFGTVQNSTSTVLVQLARTVPQLPKHRKPESNRRLTQRRMRLVSTLRMRLWPP